MQRGSGSFRKRSATSYELSVWDNEAQRRQYRTVKARNDTEARRALKGFQSEVDAGRVAASRGKPTVAQVCTEWLTHKMAVRRDLAEGTIDTYEWCLSHIVRKWGNVKVATITKGIDVERLFASLIDDGLSPKSVRNISGVLYAVLRHAMREDYVRVNACELVEDRPQVPDKPVMAPSDADLEALLSAMAEHSRPHFVHLMLSASLGSRRGETAGIRRCDVLTDLGAIRLCQSVTKLRRKGTTSGRVVVKSTMKTPAGERTVAVGPAVWDILVEHLDELDRVAQMHGLEAFPSNGFIFSPDLLGKMPYHPDSVNARIRKLCKRHDIANVTPHQLRHYAATKIAPHMPATEVMGRFGWKTQSMVQRYVDYGRARDDEAAAIMDGALGNVVPLRRRKASGE